MDGETVIGRPVPELGWTVNNSSDSTITGNPGIFVLDLLIFRGLRVPRLVTSLARANRGDLTDVLAINQQLASNKALAADTRDDVESTRCYFIGMHPSC
jgi:hypothetical protein